MATVSTAVKKVIAVAIAKISTVLTCLAMSTPGSGGSMRTRTVSATGISDPTSVTCGNFLRICHSSPGGTRRSCSLLNRFIVFDLLTERQFTTGRDSLCKREYLA